ncbi:hypothetical protein HPP92_007636 [Vanilla planifolia]|uniref:Uncharacterized protein n=1 Tax=Vanilla planifolia TaxID=51239 RepID=A0A835RR98_VANPL|nr:hypothetical protein HPP92_007636 [Vanilla planifolia]
MFDQGNETKREEKFTGFPYSTSTFAYETGSKEIVKHAPGQSNTSSRYRQCLAFIEAKEGSGRSDVPGHNHTWQKLQASSPIWLYFLQETPVSGNNGLVIADTVSASSIERLKEKQQEEGAPEKISSSYASGIQELILVREDTVSAEENLVPIKIEETLDESLNETIRTLQRIA